MRTGTSLNEALRVFTRESVGADMALVFYAGHGLEMDGVYYLVPVDARLERDTDVRFETVALDDGRGRNSPYTSALLAYLEEPLELSSLLRRVRARVLESDRRPAAPARVRLAACGNTTSAVSPGRAR